MEKSNSIKNISAALLSFHKSIGKIKRDATNDFFKKPNGAKHKYASLSNILDAIGDPLEASGLAYSQFPEGNNGLTTILMHPESGEFLQSTYEMHPTKNDPQGIGSAITYARRYALGAILGLNIDDDDDGNAASQPQKQQQPAQQPKAPPATNGTKKIDLLPDTENWNKVLKYVSENKNWTMAELQKKYNISQPVQKQLIEATLQAI